VGGSGEGDDEESATLEEEEVLVATEKLRNIASSAPPPHVAGTSDQVSDCESDLETVMRFLILTEIQQNKKESEKSDPEDSDDFVGLSAAKSQALPGVTNEASLRKRAKKVAKRYGTYVKEKLIGVTDDRQV
jgi:hypothetical protein